MKRIGLVLASFALMAFCVFLLPTETFAVTDWEKSDFSYTVADGEVTIIKGPRYFAGDVVIPATIDGYPVTSIDKEAFIAQTDLISITIPEGVTTIGPRAFSGCNSLTRVILPDTLTTIGEYAFSNCDDLAGITLPKNLITIGNCAFWKAGLSSIVIPDSVTIIGNSAFSGCGQLTQVTLGSGLKTIDNSAFSRCHRLEGIVIPANVKTVGESAFYNCFGLTYVTIGDGLTDLGEFAFYSCKNITTLKLGKGLTTIPMYAFTYCQSLTEVIIPEGVTSIEGGAFSYCNNLTYVSLPSSLRFVQAFAFEGCDRLQYNIYNGGRYLGNIDNSFLCLVGTESKDMTSFVIHEDTKLIGSGAFRFHDSLISVAIPESVIEINGAAFGECSNLLRVYYKGSQEEWNRIVIGTENESLNDATLVCDYAGCNHVWDANVIEKDPTCEEDGYKTYTCTACGESLSQEFENTKHSYVGGVCQRCGESMEADKEASTNIFATFIAAITGVIAAFLAIFGIKI